MKLTSSMSHLVKNNRKIILHTDFRDQNNFCFKVTNLNRKKRKSAKKKNGGPRPYARTHGHSNLKEMHYYSADSIIDIDGLKKINGV